MRRTQPTAFTRLLEVYCRSVGMGDDFEIDSEGGVFEADDVTIVVRHDEDFDRLSMVAAVNKFPAEEFAPLALSLLHLNAGLALSGGFAFSVDVSGGVVQLQQSIPMTSLDSDQLDAAIGAIVAKCRSARSLLATLNGAPELIQEFLANGKEPDPSFVTFRV